MNAADVIESYVLDVGRLLPKARRNDVAFELRALLGDELAGRAQREGRAPDRAMAMTLLQEFGQPADAARRYHERAALIDPADNHHFLIWALGGLIVIVMDLVLGDGKDDGGSSPLLVWLGILTLVFAAIAWWRRRHPGRFTWKPRRSADYISRTEAFFSMALMLIFPLFMYAAPQTFVDTLFLGKLSSDGVTLAPAFRDGWMRMVTMGLLVVMAALYLPAGWLRRWTPGLRWTAIVVYGALGLLFAAHMGQRLPGGGHLSQVFVLPYANTVASPFFGLVAAIMLLSAMYMAWLEWSRVDPAPAPAPANA